jgi:hypothetical protein
MMNSLGSFKEMSSFGVGPHRPVGTGLLRLEAVLLRDIPNLSLGVFFMPVIVESVFHKILTCSLAGQRNN